MCRSAVVAGVLATSLIPYSANSQVVTETGGTRPTSGHAGRSLTALSIKDAIRVDGVLDDAAWSRAMVTKDFTQSEPREGQPATEPTEVMVAFDDQYLYIGARMRDSDPGREIVNDIRKDFREDDQDDFEVIIDTFRDRRNGYIFIVNP